MLPSHMPNSYNLIEGDCGMTDIEKQAKNYIQTSCAPERLNNKHLLPEITYEITKNIASYETGTKRAWRIAELCLLSEDILSDNAVLNLYNKLKTRKRATEMLTVLQNSQRIRRLLLLPEQDEDDLSKALKAFFDRGRLEMDICIIVPKTRLSMLDRVLLRDSQSNAPRFIAECAVVPYLQQLRSGETLHINAKADKAAEYLDKASLLSVLRLLQRCAGPEWYVPYGRYIDRTNIKDMLKAAGSGNDYAYKGSALSDTREAMLFFEKKKDSGFYARVHHKLEEEFQDKILGNFSFDAQGRKVYDLGSRQIQLTLQQNLTVVLQDIKTGKILKSIPTKGLDQDLVAKASDDYAETKANIKAVARDRKKLLLQQFVSGDTQEAGQWEEAYLKNPVLRQIAELIVWNQGKETFTIKKNSLISVAQKPYCLDLSKPIGVAHPMEMSQAEASPWQNYFRTNEISQPFQQVWEPTKLRTGCSTDRYKGISVPAYYFLNRENDGIRFKKRVGYSSPSLELTNCELDFTWKPSNGIYFTPQDLLCLGDFRVKCASRAANHIICLLDSWTFMTILQRDELKDTSVLEGSTEAQIQEYIDFSIAHKLTSNTAVLLDYKHEHFGYRNSFDDFVLDL